MTQITRRNLLLSAAATGFVSLDAALADVPQVGRPGPAFYRFKLGGCELTALYDGIWSRPIDATFVRNAPFAEVRKALAENFLSTDKIPLPINAMLVNTGARLILIDTGTAGQMDPMAGSLMTNLAAAGVEPSAIDTVVISHFHPDHINGLKTKDNALNFPNAEIKVPAPEWSYWMEEMTPSTVPPYARGVLLNAQRIFGDLGKAVTRFEAGAEVAPGITSVPAYGHTPGHCAYAIESDGQSMMVLCDTTNHPWLFVRHPEWQPIFDMDGPTAVALRRKLLDRMAADRMLVHGTHFPFPATGHIARAGHGYEFVPVQWQAL